MPHRTGSKPIREIIYELVNKSWNPIRKPPFCIKDLIVLTFFIVKGGKDGNPPNMATIFFETRKKGNELVEPETNEKYVCLSINFI